MRQSILPALLLFAFAATAFPQTTDQPDEHAADRDALRQIGAQYEKAINTGDLRSLAASVDPAATAVFATNDEIQGLEAMQNFFDSIKQRLGKGSTYTVHLLPDRTEFYGETALARGKSDETATLGSGRQYNFQTHWTAVLRRDAGTWKAVRLQVTMDPFSNVAVIEQIKFRTWLVAAIGLIVAVIAFFIGRRRAA